MYNSRQDEEFVTLLRSYNKQSSVYINAIKKELWSSKGMINSTVDVFIVICMRNNAII